MHPPLGGARSPEDGVAHASAAEGARSPEDGVAHADLRMKDAGGEHGGGGPGGTGVHFMMCSSRCACMSMRRGNWLRALTR